MSLVKFNNLSDTYYHLFVNLSKQIYFKEVFL